jgi:hypothetical protein
VAVFRNFLERRWLPARVVLALFAVDFLALVVLCNDYADDGRTIGIPSALVPFTENWLWGDGVSSLALGLACSHVSLLTLWVLYGRSWLEVRWGALLLGISACVIALSSFYGRQCPAPSVSLLFVAQALSLLVSIPLLRIRLFPPTELSETEGRKWQFSIRTLLLVTSLVAIGITVVPQIDLGIFVKESWVILPRPMGALLLPSSLDFLLPSGGPKFVCIWKLLLASCCTLSVLLCILAVRGRSWAIPVRLLLATAITSVAVVTLIWFTVDHSPSGRRFFYPPFNGATGFFYNLSNCHKLFLPWIGWILVQIAVVSSVLLAFQWGAKKNRDMAS